MHISLDRILRELIILMILRLLSPLEECLRLDRKEPAVQSLTHGYVLGGFASSVYRLDFANDTATMSTRGNLADSRREFGAAGNLTHAYIMGDGDAMKIDYSNDTATATYLSPTVSGGSNTYATGSLTHGYLATSDYIQRFDYSNDTASPSSYNQFSTSLGSNGGASGNADFGYFVGRSNKDLHRLNFANDTVTPKTRGSLANGPQNNMEREHQLLNLV